MYNIVDRASIIGVSDTTILDNVSMFYGQFYKYQTAPIGPKRLECPIYYENEIFLPYPKNNNYLISDYGRVYSILNGCIIISNIYNGNKLGINMIDPISETVTSYYLPKAIKETFEPIENSDYLYIDFIDGNYRNYMLWNLKWCIPKRIIFNEIKDGKVIINHNNIYDNKSIIFQTKKLLKNNISYIDISRILKVPYDYYFINFIKQMEKNIKNQEQTELNNRKYIRFQINEKIVSNIAELLSQGISYTKIATIVGMEYNSHFRHLLLYIKRGLIYPEIAKAHNILEPVN